VDICHDKINEVEMLSPAIDKALYATRHKEDTCQQL